MLYLIEILHQTTTARNIYRQVKKLYLIEILHQTTTYGEQQRESVCCILSKFYIKPQPIWLRNYVGCSCILSKFYIKPQPNVLLTRFFFVVSYRNSTSNHNVMAAQAFMMKLYLIEILHQTTTPVLARFLFIRCILSKFYIKPQPSRDGK